MMPTKLQIPLQGRPCGKARYYRQAGVDAHRSAWESWERSQGRAALHLGPLNVDWSDACRAWHVGHRVV
jgi:hypothetical protein